MKIGKFRINIINLLIKAFAVILLSATLILPFLPRLEDTNAISSEILEDKKDTFLTETTDSFITTKTDLPRNIPTETVGKFAREKYGIPGVSTADQSLWSEILAENKELLSNLPEKIANGQLKKHVAADGQFYGTVDPSAKAVERVFYFNSNLYGKHSTGLFIPAGEVATITIPEVHLSGV